MTVGQLVLNNPDVSFISIVSNDYRRCKDMKRDLFIRKYKGTDVWHEVYRGRAFLEDKKYMEIWL